MSSLIRLIAYEVKEPRRVFYRWKRSRSKKIDVDNSFIKSQNLWLVGDYSCEGVRKINRGMDFSYDNVFLYAKRKLKLKVGSRYLLIHRSGNCGEASLDLESVRLAEYLLQNGAERVVVIEYNNKKSVDDCLYDSKRKNRVRDFDLGFIREMAKWQKGLEYFLE